MSWCRVDGSDGPINSAPLQHTRFQQKRTMELSMTTATRGPVGQHPLLPSWQDS